MHNITNQLTEQTKTSSDTTAPSMAIGGGGQMIQHLDDTGPETENPEKNKTAWTPEDKDENDISEIDTIAGADKPTPDPKPDPKQETNKTQGEYQAELNEIQSQIDRNNGYIDIMKDVQQELRNWLASNPNTRKYQDYLAIVGKLRQIGGDVYKNVWGNGGTGEDMVTRIQSQIDEYNKLNAPLYDKKYQIENKSNYDNRPYEDIRADTAYQRAVDDMAKAGLNKYGLSGGVSFGGSSSSRNDEEDEKKKKKKRELEEARRRAEEIQRAEEMRKSNDMMKVLGVIAGMTGTAGLVGSSVFNGIERTKQAQINADSKNVDKITQSYNKKGELYDQQYTEYIKRKK